MSGESIHSFITLIGSISVTEDGEGRITALYLPNQNLPAMEENETDVLAEAEGQLNEYLSGRRARFDLPLDYSGPPFRTAVLEALLDIPMGEVRTYAEIAGAVGSPKAYRAVGSACAANPIPIIIPCHRVVPSTGGVGSYAGGSAMKRRLLEFEGVDVDGLQERAPRDGRPGQGGVRLQAHTRQGGHPRGGYPGPQEDGQGHRERGLEVVP